MIKGLLPNKFKVTFETSCKRLSSRMPTVEQIEDTTFPAQEMGKYTFMYAKILPQKSRIRLFSPR